MPWRAAGPPPRRWRTRPASGICTVRTTTPATSEEAKSAYERRIAADTADVKAHGALAAIALRLGDTTTLERQRRWLSARDEAIAFLGLARIAALEGRRAEAVSLVRQALDRDLERHFLHLDPDLDPLHEYPPFRELMRFRG